MKQDYEVRVDGWLDGTYRQKGDVLSLSQAEAKHLEIVGSIALKKTETAIAEDITPAKSRRGIALPLDGRPSGSPIAAPEEAV